MISYWLTMISMLGYIGLALLALFFLLLPLLRKGSSDGVSQRADEGHRQWYRQRLQEMDHDAIDPEARESLQQELAAVLLAEDELARARQRERTRTIAQSWTWVASALVLGLSVLVYNSQSDSGLPLVKGAEIVLSLDATAQSDELRVWQERLQDRLADAPEDAKSWYLFGHAQLKLGQPMKAAEAFAKTDSLVGSDVSVKFYWLQARLLATDGELNAVSEAIANDIIALDPNNGPVLELLSVSMMQRGELPDAVKLMNRALNAAVSVDRQIGLAGAMRILRGRMDAAAPHIEVAIVAKEPPIPDATVFVVARPAGGGMPYAAVRRPAAMLPFTVRLDDLVGMTEQRVLSNAETFEVVVRLSVSGSPQEQSGDWVWRSETLDLRDYESGKKLQASLASG